MTSGNAEFIAVGMTNGLSKLLVQGGRRPQCSVAAGGVQFVWNCCQDRHLVERATGRQNLR